MLMVKFMVLLVTGARTSLGLVSSGTVYTSGSTLEGPGLGAKATRMHSAIKMARCSAVGPLPELAYLQVLAKYLHENSFLSA